MSTWPARRAKLMENAENRESAAEHVGTAMLHEVQCMRVRVLREKRATPEIGAAKLTGISAVVRALASSAPHRGVPFSFTPLSRPRRI